MGGEEWTSKGPVGKGKDRNKLCVQLEWKHQSTQTGPHLFRPVVRLNQEWLPQAAFLFTGAPNSANKCK